MNKDEMKKIAHLARIKFSEQELDRFSGIPSILAFSEQINQLDTSHVEPLSHPLDIPQRLRADHVTELPRSEALQQLEPGHLGTGLYLVPAVLETE